MPNGQKLKVAEVDSDLAWLLSYLPAKTAPPLQFERVEHLYTVIGGLIGSDRLPFTVGVFGGWGSGKTTFLSLLAEKIIHDDRNDYKVIYFNAWKYAGFIELVPSLIYKVLKYGNHAAKDPRNVIRDIMLSLGKDYGDKFGEWAAERVGVNPTKLFKDATNVYHDIREGIGPVPNQVIDAYYTQLDRAQDLLLKFFSDRSKVTVVLIDELDRCDPGEAFEVIKQLRVFFAMRNVPIAFVICANPEPIGLAIKHKYGLTSASGEFESRRILEKFVDVYYDMSEPQALDEFVRWLWQGYGERVDDLTFFHLLDSRFVVSEPDRNTLLNVTALQAMQTDNLLYSNLRLLSKTLDRVTTRVFPNKFMLWTAWHLELVGQMDPGLRREIRQVSRDLTAIVDKAYQKVLTSPLEWRKGKLNPQANKDGTLFGFYRSVVWDVTRNHWRDLAEKSQSADPEATERFQIIGRWLSDYKIMDFICLTTLIPIPDPSKLLDNPEKLKDLSSFVEDMRRLRHPLGWLLANY